MARIIPGEGNPNASVMLIGERPGKEENAYGRPFVGKSGKELWRYLWDSCHLLRDDVWTTNLVKTWAPGDADPSPEEIERDKAVLEAEIESVRPAWVVALGRHSSRYLLGDVDMEVVHGLPRLVRDFVVVPVYHPAAGLHSTEFQGLIAWDFERLARTMKGELEPVEAEDEHPEPDYFEIDGSNLFKTVMAVDTEGSIEKPWCLTASDTPGMAVCDREGKQQFGHIILHNAMHDLGVLRSMGTGFGSFDDTMVMAYELCVEPQGLKALAKRYCGMEMHDYSELIAEPDRRLAMEFLKGAKACLSSLSKGGLTASSAIALNRKRLTQGKDGKSSGKIFLRKRRS